MIELKHHNYQYYNRWLEMAMADEKVWPFLTHGNGKNYNIDVSDDWLQCHFISDAGYSLASIYINRREHSGNLLMHTVSQAGELMKKRESFSLITSLFSDHYIFKRFDLKFIDFSCHSTNYETLKFYNKRCTPWGIKPQGAYDRKSGEWVDAYYYRLKRDDVNKAVSSLFSAKYKI